MNRSVFILLVFFITACHPYNPWPPEYNAKAMLVGDRVCVLAPVNEGEYLYGVTIKKSGQENDYIRHFFNSTDPDLKLLKPNQCVPMSTYYFELGQRYYVSITSIHLEKSRVGTEPSRKIYNVSFDYPGVEGVGFYQGAG